jgi:hypothetical protein
MIQACPNKTIDPTRQPVIKDAKKILFLRLVNIPGSLVAKITGKTKSDNFTSRSNHPYA